MENVKATDGSFGAETAKAWRVAEFGGTEKMILKDIPVPNPGPGEVLVRVKAAGVGPWDAWIRAGKSALPQPLPLTLGADLAGIVIRTGPTVIGLQPGASVFGVSNTRFTGAYAEYAIASSAMISRMSPGMAFDNAASVPIVAVTAWQALFDHAKLWQGHTVLIHGAAGNVGRYAVQMAHAAGVRIIATASARDATILQSLGADRVLDYRSNMFEQVVQDVDAVIDLVGGDVQRRSFPLLKKGGALISAVTPPDQSLAAQYGVAASFFLVDVNTALLDRIAAMIQSQDIRISVGRVLPFAAARRAHDMVEGREPHPAGKIVLHIAD